MSGDENSNETSPLLILQMSEYFYQFLFSLCAPIKKILLLIFAYPKGYTIGNYNSTAIVFKIF